MARTPLLGKFQALFEDFEEADRSGRTVEAVQEERTQMRLTRCHRPAEGGGALASFSGNPTDPKVVAGFAKTFLSQIEPVYSLEWKAR